MSFYVGAGLWMGVGVVLGYWAADAERKWQGLLTEHGLMPEGSDSPAAAALQPVTFFRRRWAYLNLAYPRALRSSDPEIETWRLRRTRRRRLFIAWMFGGLIIAILTIATIEIGQDNPLWLAVLLPIAAALLYLIRFGYEYGSVAVNEVDAD